MTDRELIEEAISIYVESLREDNDPHNNSLADQLDEVKFFTKEELDEARKLFLDEDIHDE